MTIQQAVAMFGDEWQTPREAGVRLASHAIGGAVARRLLDRRARPAGPRVVQDSGRFEYRRARP